MLRVSVFLGTSVVPGSLTSIPPWIPSLAGLCVRMWSSARGALASKVMGSSWPDPKTRAQIRSRGGYSLVLNEFAVSFPASAQLLAVVSAAL